METEKPTKLPIYIGYTQRLVIYSCLLPVLSIITILFLYKSFKVDDIINIRYKEQGIVQYKIYDADKKQVLSNNHQYSQDQIHTIHLDMGYQFFINKESNLQFQYQALSDLVIIDKNHPETVYYKETIPLMESQEKTIKKGKKTTLRNTFIIDYQEYNDIAQKYIESYKVETISYLEIHYNINYHTTRNHSFLLMDNCENYIKIPLAESTISIEKEEVLREKRVNKKPTIHIDKPRLLEIGILFGIAAIFSLIQLIILISSTMHYKSDYDRVLERIQKRYKRRLILVPKAPKISNNNKITVHQIKELVKISKKTKKPIKYCIINEHNKSQFFIEEEDKIISYYLKAIDLEKKD